MRRIRPVLVLVVLAALFVAGLTASASARPAAKSRIVLESFQAIYDGNVTTHYRAVATDLAGDPLTFNWLMAFPQGECGTLGGAHDIAGSDQTFTENGEPGSSPNEWIGEADYAHPGCAHPVEFGARLTLEVSDGACFIEYTQGARDNDSPGVVRQLPPTSVSRGSCAYTPPATTTAATTTVSATPTAAGAVTPDQKKAYKQYSHGGKIVSGLVACGGGLLLVPEPVATKVVGGILLAAAAGLAALSEYADELSDDPPDPHFTRIAKPVFTKLPLLAAGNGITIAQAGALNRYLTAESRYGAYVNAMYVTNNRASGASRAHNSRWHTRQVAALRAYARSAATYLSRARALRVQVVAAIVTLPSVPLPLATLEKIQAAIGTSGLPARLSALLRGLGLSTAQVAAVAASAMHAKLPAGGTTTRDLLNDVFVVSPSLRAAEQKTIAALDQVAAGHP